MIYSLGAFLPDEVLPLVLMAAGLLFMFGLRRIGGLLILLVLADALLLPFAEPLVEMLPGWLLVLIVVLFVLGVSRELVAIFVGRGAADTMIGSLAADFVRLLIFFPRVAGRMVMRLFNWR